MTSAHVSAVRNRPHVVIAGGGVGALETALALRALCGRQIGIDLVAPEDDFVYRALTVAEPFGYERALRVPLARLERTHGVAHRRDRVTAVHPSAQTVELASGERLAYDALVVATGVGQQAWLDGSECFTGPDAPARVSAVLERLAAGDIQELAFAAPAVGWTLPLYELALLTARWCADRGVIGAALSISTPEAQPLEAFGRAASHTVRDLLSDHGIAFYGRTVPAVAADLRADAVVSLPQLAPAPVPGLLADAAGFIPVDEYAAVRGRSHVWAVGDITDQPIKQGGLATQQADCAATAIAHGFGVPVEPVPFRPVLRGMLIGGMSPAFLRREGPAIGEAGFDALWWPPTKVAGHHLGPYLTDAHGIGATQPLADRPAPENTAAAARDRAEVRRVAVDLARAEAGWGDYDTALRWLQTVEWLDGVLPPELAGLRQEWLAQR